MKPTIDDKLNAILDRFDLGIAYNNEAKEWKAVPKTCNFCADKQCERNEIDCNLGCFDWTGY